MGPILPEFEVSIRTMRLAVTLKYFSIIILVNWGYWLDLCWLVSNSTTCIRFVNSQLVYPCRLGFVNRFRDYLNNWLQFLPSWQSTLRRSAFQRDGKWVMWFWMKRKLQSSPFLYSTRKWLPDVWSFLSIFLQFQFGYVRRFRVNCYCFSFYQNLLRIPWVHGIYRGLQASLLRKAGD